MMETFRWTDYIDEKNISVNFEAKDKNDAIAKMIDMLYNSGAISDRAEFSDSVFSREDLGSTGIGEEVAMPHGKSQVVRNMAVAIARLTTPLDFDSVDKKPVKFIFMIASPTGSDSLYIKVMASIIRGVKMQDICRKMQALGTPFEIFNMLKSEYPQAAVRSVS